MSVRVGIIGTGFGAAVHAPILKKHTEYELAAIASMRPGRAQQVAADLEIPRFYDDWRHMLADDCLDLVVIATKPSDHVEMVPEALAAGCHILCEKPPALNLAQAESMALAAVKSGRVAGMNFEWRYLRERQAIERSLRENRLGDIFHVNWSEAWSLWPHIQQDDPSWDWLAEEGGGMLGSIGSHIIDALCHWFGPLVSVKGNTVNHVPKRKRQDNWVTTTADDSFSFLGKFECGATCTVSCTIAAVGRPLQVEIFGSQGTLRLNGHDLAMATSDSKEFRAMNVISTVDVSQFPMDIKPYVHAQWALYNDLAQAIEGVTCDSLPSLDDAVRVQAVMDAIHS